MMLDFHANYYASLKASGKEQLFEDDEFDAQKILADLENQAGDEWEDVEDWSVDKPGELPEE